jgi:lipopolysaccharide export system permease protein
MSADGEIATIKSAGISPLRVLTPAFCFGLLLSPLAVWLGDLAVSWGGPGLNRVVFESVDDIVYRMLRAQRSYSTPKGLSIHVQDVQGRSLINPVITVHSGSRQNEPVTFYAKEGRLELDKERMALNLHLKNFRLLGKVHGGFQGEQVIPIPLDKALRKGSVSNSSPSELPMREVAPEAIKQIKQLAEKQQELAAQTALALATGQWDDIAGKVGQELDSEIALGSDRLDRLRTEPWRRWAGGFSCFAFIVIGAPLAIILRTADPWMTFGICFLPILLLYYPLFLFGLDQAKGGDLPPYSVWLGNVALMGIAAILTRRVWRY